MIFVLLPPVLLESFELLLARALDLIQSGQPVRVAYCSSCLGGCIANPFGLKQLCSHCTALTSKILDEYGLTQHSLPLCIADNSSASQNIDLRFVKSTILSRYRVDPDSCNTFLKSDVTKNVIRLISNNLARYSAAYLASVKRAIKKESHPRIEFFNGRLSPYSEIHEFVRSCFIDFVIVEMAGRQRVMQLFYNQSPHSISSLKSKLRAYIVETKNFEPGIDFFNFRMNSIPTNDAVYSSNFRPFSYKKTCEKVIAVFLSSPDELLANSSDWFTDLSANPVASIAKMQGKLSGKNYRWIIRFHPNQAKDFSGLTFAQLKEAAHLNTDTIIIDPNQRDSSYDIISISDVVVSFGSTIGLEAVYAGKPSILIGRQIWEDPDLNVCYHAVSIDAACELLSADIPPKPRSSAIAIGSFFMSPQQESSNLGNYSECNGIPNINGRHFLVSKRQSIWYVISRLLDKLLIMSIIAAAPKNRFSARNARDS